MCKNLKTYEVLLSVFLMVTKMFFVLRSATEKRLKSLNSLKGLKGLKSLKGLKGLNSLKILKGLKGLKGPVLKIVYFFKLYTFTLCTTIFFSTYYLLPITNYQLLLSTTYMIPYSSFLFGCWVTFKMLPDFNNNMGITNPKSSNPKC